jgi:hypothetical protein
MKSKHTTAKHILAARIGRLVIGAGTALAAVCGQGIAIHRALD